MAGHPTQIGFPGPGHHLLHVSQVNAWKPDLERFPRLKGVVPLEIILEPGDMLFIPAY